MKSVKQFAASFLSAACLANSALFAAEPATAAFNPDSVVKSVEKALAPLKEQVAKEDLAYQNTRIFVDMQGGSFPGHETVGGLPGRPFMIWMTECNPVRIEGVTLRNSASWMESYIACGNLVIRNLKVQNFSNFNNDGINVGGGSKKDAARTSPELAANYPEGKMFGKLPAHGIYFRHVDGAVFSPSCAPTRKSNFLAVI
jgi:hypothetical protein